MGNTCSGPLDGFDGRREFNCAGDARYVWISIPGSGKVLNFCEVEVYGIAGAVLGIDKWWSGWNDINDMVAMCEGKPQCVAPPVNGGCDETISGTNQAGYRGCQDKTTTGKTCQMWTAQSPHAHTRTLSNYPNKGLGTHNYCRNPDNEPNGIWCYTQSSSSRWEYCDPLPPSGGQTLLASS